MLNKHGKRFTKVKDKNFSITTKKQTTTTKKTTTTSNNITIGFNTNGGHHIDTITVEAGQVLTYPIPVREGYTFVGWYNNGVAWDLRTPIHRNVVLTAKWTVE